MAVISAQSPASIGPSNHHQPSVAATAARIGSEPKKKNPNAKWSESVAGGRMIAVARLVVV